MNPLPVEAGDRVKKRYLVGAGAAACAVCCAPPIVALLGIAGGGLAATFVTMTLTGLAFGLVVLVGTIVAVIRHRRGTAAAACTPSAPEPVRLTLSSAPDRDAT